ncbi:MAG: type II secretion system F family protein [Pseudomonadota bacterium]|nr:type II secretion system F family protein [Pseudomonadota bacterium]
MAVFKYEGRTATGEAKKGVLEASDQNAARQRLREMRIQATTLSESKSALDFQFKLPSPNFLKPSIKIRDLVIFTRQFATMIDSGLPLVQCIDIQATQAENPTLRAQLKVVKEKVESGSTFGDALKTFPETFDALYVNLVAAGEVGGMLDTIMTRLAAYLEKNQKLIRQVKGAMSYPVIVLVVAFIVVTLLLLKVVPTFEDMFADFGAALPAPTLIVLALSKWLQANFLYLIVGIVVTFFAVGRFYRTSRGRLLIDGILLKLPIFGDLLTKVAVARFCRTLGTMISSGVPILEALGICGRTAGNQVIENAIERVAVSISEGRTISEPLMEAKVFPQMVCQMISVGEATGALDTMLTKVADFYDEEVDASVEGLTAMLEPLIMAFLGIVIGGLVIAMYMPIFEMAGHVG